MSIHPIKSKVLAYYSRVQTVNLTKKSPDFCIFKKNQTLFKTQVEQPPLKMFHVDQKKGVGICSLLAIIIAAMFLGSCQKEQLSDAALNSTTSDASAEAKIARPLSRGNGGNGGNDEPTNYGAFICAPDHVNRTDFELDVADKLGISCLRERVIVPAKSLNKNLVPELNTRYTILLNFVTPNNSGKPLPFVSNLREYKQDLNNILNTFTVMPKVAVIENEESNRFYYDGKPEEYIDQLEAAIEVMHARGIKVTNGGITSQGLEYLVYEDFLDQGKRGEAERFQKLTNVTPNNPTTQERGEFIDELLEAYTKMNLDYVNFHWKSSTPDTDTEALEDIIDYLKKRTNKKILTTEIGQFDEDPDTLESLMQLSADKGLSYVIWYSPDENDHRRDTPLHHDDRSLTRTGDAYHDYLKD